MDEREFIARVQGLNQALKALGVTQTPDQKRIAVLEGELAAQAEALATARQAEQCWQEEAMQARQLAATMANNWEQAQADAAGYRRALTDIRDDGPELSSDEACGYCCHAYDHADAALAGSAGAALLQKMHRLEAVEE